MTCRSISARPPNKVVVVATGALTNVALLLSIYPELADDIEVGLPDAAWTLHVTSTALHLGY